MSGFPLLEESKWVCLSKPPPPPWITEKYLNHGHSRFSTPPQTLSVLLSLRLQYSSLSPYYLLMAYFNHNASFDSTLSALEEFDSYPFLRNQSLVTTEGVHHPTTSTFAGGWTTVVQPRSVASPSASAPATTNYGEHLPILIPIDFYLTREYPHSAPSMVDSYQGSSHAAYWPTIGQSTRQNYPVASSQDDLFPSRQGWEITVPALAPNTCKHHFRP